MAVVRGEAVHLVALRVEREREVTAVLDPEVAVEAAFQSSGLALEAVRELGVLPGDASQPSPADLGVVRVTLELAGRPREAGQPPVAVRDRVPGVLPALVLEAGLLVSALIPDVSVAEQVRVVVDPGEGGSSLELELAHELGVAGPALVLVEQHHVQRRRVCTAVVRRVWTLLERRHLAVPHFAPAAAGGP